MEEQELRFAGSEEPRPGLRDVHRWYLFTVPGGATTRVGLTREAASARLAADPDEAALDAWAVETGLRVLSGRRAEDIAEIVLDLPSADDAPPRRQGHRAPEDTGDPLDHGSPPDPDAPTDRVWRGNTLREPSPGD